MEDEALQALAYQCELEYREMIELEEYYKQFLREE